MLNKKFINFALLLLFSNKKTHLSIFFISILIVFILSSVIFISSSIQKDIFTTLSGQPSFVVQRYKAGKVLDTPASWIDEFLEIDGINNVQGRVYGTHFFEPNEKSFLIVGIDVYDKQILKSLKNLVKNLDIDKFTSKDYMIIGNGVKKILDKYEYKNSYTFRPPDRSRKKVYIYDTLPKQSDIVSNDMVIVDIDLAREILGIDEDMVSDIIIDIKNPLELQNIKNKLIVTHFDMRIISKEDIQKEYKNTFNYKGGIFLTTYIVVLLTFFIILYQRYTTSWHVQSKEIAILRSVGWRINEVIFLKLFENFIIAFFAYAIGVILAFVFVFFLNAPLLKYIFLGYSNLELETVFYPNIDISTLVLIFLFFVVPFMISIIVPVWRSAIKDATEVMR